MAQVQAKVCRECGLDVTHLKRVRDQSGTYHCPTCWDANIQAAQGGLAQTTSRQEPPPTPPTPLPKPVHESATTSNVRQADLGQSNLENLPTGGTKTQNAKSATSRRLLIAASVAVPILLVVVGVAAVNSRGTHQGPANHNLAGPSGQDQTTQPPNAANTRIPKISDDPAASFEAFSSAYVMAAKALSKKQFDMDADLRIGWADSVSCSVNVEKSNSLMSPYIGTIDAKGITSSLKPPEDMKRFANSDGRMLDGHTVRLTFFAQKGRWLLKGVNSRSELGRNDTSGTLTKFMNDVYQSIPQG